MRQTKGIRVALVLMACLCAAVAWGTVSAWAAVPWRGDGFAGSIEVQATGSDDEAFVADIAEADVQLDVYRIATARQDDNYLTYRYDYVAPFGEGELDTTTLDTAGWQAIADQAAKQVKGVDHETVAAGTVLDQVDDGLYLVLAHDSDHPVSYDDEGAVVLQAASNKYLYSFEAALVTMPSKDGVGPDGIPNTAYGEWVREARASLKPRQTPLYGDLQITKTVENYDNKPATFVFHIYNEEVGYDNYAAVNVDAQTGATATTTVTRIPAGISVTVEEVYSGARYEAQTSAREVAIVAGQTADVGTFENVRNDVPDDGFGIENHFEVGGDGWQWEKRTATKVVPDASE